MVVVGAEGFAITGSSHKVLCPAHTAACGFDGSCRDAISGHAKPTTYPASLQRTGKVNSYAGVGVGIEITIDRLARSSVS